MTNEEIAEVCHEANRALCEAFGDHSQKPWAHAEPWQRKAALAGVKHHLEHPDAPVFESHMQWALEKHNDGWVYGAVKDGVAKTHPCLVSFDDLPPDQKAKDYIHKAIATTLGRISGAEV